METAEQFIKRRDAHFKEIKEKYKKTKADKHLKWFPDINRKGCYGFLKEAWTFMPQYNINEKLFIIERLRLVKIVRPITHGKMKVNDVEYRFGYYMVGKNGNKINKWTWGESCPIIPAKDFDKLIKQAKKERTIV